MGERKTLLINHLQGSSNPLITKPLNKDRATDICVIAFNGSEKGLARKGISYKTPQDYLRQEDTAQLEASSTSFVKSLGSQKIEGDTTLARLLQYDETSLWWFMEGILWRHVIRDLFRYLQSLELVIEEERPSKMLVVNDNSLLAKAVIALGQAKDIPVQTLPPRFTPRVRRAVQTLGLRVKTELAAPQVKSAVDLLRRGMERLFGPFPSSSQEEGKGRTLLLASMERGLRVVDPASGKKVRVNAFLGPVIEKLREDGDSEMVFLYSFPRLSQLKVPGEVRRSCPVVRPWEYYLGREIRDAVSVRRRLLRKKWQELEKSPSFQALFRHQGVPLWDILKEHLKVLFYISLPGFIRDIEIAKRVLEKEDIDLVLVAEDGSLCHKAMLAAAFSRKVPRVMLQTGVMTVSNMLIEHAFNAAETEEKTGPSRWSLIPEKYCAYGEESRNILKKARYPSYDSIVITGEPRYDRLARASEIFNRERFCHTWELDLGKRIALVASQPFRMFGSRESLFIGLFQAFKACPETQLVVKPHPAMKEEKWYRSLAREMGVKVTVLPRKYDTNEALYACDVLITFYSTVALEAMIMGKPVVTINLTGQPDPMPFARSGAALGIYRAEDIAPGVKRALEDPETRKNLEKARGEFLSHQFYKLDGQATGRIVDLIYALTRERGSKILGS